MRFSSLLFLFVICSVNVFSQKQPVRYQLESMLFIDKNMKCFLVDSNERVIADSSFRWDSNLKKWLNSNKMVYTFEKENLTLREMYFWDHKNKEWGFERKDEYIYNDKGQKEAGKVLMWDKKEQHWVLTEQREYKYDENGNEVYMTNIIKPSIGDELQTLLKYNREYDNNNNLTMVICSQTKEGGTEYVEQSKEERRYDANGNEISLVVYERNIEDKLVEFSKIVTQFDQYGKDKLVVTSNWDSKTNKWVNHKKMTYLYKKGVGLLTYHDWFWSKSDGEWVADVKKVNTYNKQNKKSSYIVYFWNKKKSDWDQNNKKTYSYDVFGNVLSISDHRMDIQAGVWKDNYVKNYTYDIRIPLEDVIQKGEKKLKKTKPKHAVTSEKLFDWDERTQTWKLHESWEFNYSEH